MIPPPSELTLLRKVKNMSSPTFASFAILGAGNMGVKIVKALLAFGASVIVISRPSSAPKDIPTSVKTLSIDYTDKPALAAAFKQHQVEVIISTLNSSALSVQIDLAEAGVEAGVKLFVPSEYGIPSEGRDSGMHKKKSDIADRISALGLPTARVYVGMMHEYLPWLVGLESGKVYIVGKGETAMSWTAMEDAAGFIAFALTSLPESELANSTLRIEGERKTILDAVSLYKGKYPVEHGEVVPEADGSIGLRTRAQQSAELGKASTGYNPLTDTDDPSTIQNDLWKGHEWKTIQQVLGL